MANLRWDKHHQKVLIERVKARTCLWDIRHPDYRNFSKKQALFEKITSEIVVLRPGTTVDEVKKRWGNLRCQFSENIRTSKSKLGKTRQLWCKAQLMFLMDVTFPRPNNKGNTCVESDEASNAEEGLSDEIDTIDLEPSESVVCFPSLPAGAAVTTEKHRKLSELPVDPVTMGAPSSPSILPTLHSLPQDAIDKYAHCVASELRLIQQPQQLVLAKWQIQNVLFQAQLGMLAGPPPATLANVPMELDGQCVQTLPTQAVGKRKKESSSASS